MEKKFGITRYEYASDKVPLQADGVKIVQVSDLHNAVFGEGNRALLSAIKGEKPDYLFVTGDAVDSRRRGDEISLAFLARAAEIAPVYYVTGNHERRMEDLDTWISRVKGLGVTFLDGATREERGMQVLGIDSEIFEADGAGELPAFEKGGFTVALAHKPHFIQQYARYGIDLVFCGHAHGGQFRLPLVGGLYAPGQGLFPKYTAGLYREGNTAMIVSRGLGDSSFPLRLNNPPELVVCTLKRRA